MTDPRNLSPPSVRVEDHGALMLVVEILDARSRGNTDSLAGNSDDDLWGAAEAAREALDRIIAELP